MQIENIFDFYDRFKDHPRIKLFESRRVEQVITSIKSNPDTLFYFEKFPEDRQSIYEYRQEKFPNLFISNIEQPFALTEVEKTQWINELYFHFYMTGANTIFGKIYFKKMKYNHEHKIHEKITLNYSALQ